MADKTQPVLTIGMIFKDEIRCLERCLKSLKPLRESVPCELIMADTGSSDGSRKIAAFYADILFDFPWQNDFSAARNAVMNRASGKWYMTVDADEYLDSNISELLDLLMTYEKFSVTACSVIQRNYGSYEMDEQYSDCAAVRLLRMSAGLRYEGIIHERWPFTQRQIQQIHHLPRTVFHHDGYADSDNGRMQAKIARNITLLKETLAKEPQNMTALLQYVESSRPTPEHLDVVRQALTAVKEKWTGWQLLGAPLLRHAVRAAKDHNLPELQEWVRQAENEFPQSFFTRIDVEYIAISYDWDQQNYASCIRRGEICLKALAEYRHGKGNQNELLYSALLMATPYWEQGLRIFLADAYLQEEVPERCAELLSTLDWTLLDETQIENFIRVIRKLHSQGSEKTESILECFWNEVNQSISDRQKRKKRLNAFYNAAALAFTVRSQDEEKVQKNFCRLSYTLFLPLKDSCEIGRGAAVLLTKNMETIHNILSEVKEWRRFPAEALSHAIFCGISFPLENHPLAIEDMDNLIQRMAADKEKFFGNLWDTAKKSSSNSLQKKTWMRGMVLMAVQIFEWNNVKKTDSDIGINLARLFAQTEKEFISVYYKPELLCGENLCVLPPMHRLGWYCAQAFHALDDGNPTEYIRNLHTGLDSHQDGSAMIQYLLEHTPELQKSRIPEELVELAEQVRAILSTLPEDSPEVKVLKASSAYQKVAQFIENNEI